MIPAAFDYVAPESLDDALDALREGGEDAKVLAGGHSLIPLMKLRLAAPALLVVLRRVPVLTGIERSNGTVRIVVRGELDMETGPRAEEELRRAESDRPDVLVLDLREVTFFDSTGLQIVLDADVRAREEGRTFVVLAGDGEPRRVLELAEVTDRLNLEE